MAVNEKDNINTKYRQLFTVKLLHNSYGIAHKNSLEEVIRVEPDEATQRLMRNYSMSYRFINDTLICFIRTGMFAPPAPLPVTPFLKFSAPKLFRFLVFASPEFLVRTDVEAAGATVVYQFTNKVNAGTGGFISIHAAGVDVDDLKAVGLVKPAKSCFAVIDIVSGGASASAYELFDGAINQQLKNPAFSIRFKTLI